MSTSVTLIAGCAIVTAAIKAAGPIVLGGRELPPQFLGVVSLLAPALLAALVVTADAGRRPGARRRRPHRRASLAGGAGRLAHGLDHRLRRRGRRGHRRPARRLRGAM